MKSILQPLFDVLPLEQAMPNLLPKQVNTTGHVILTAKDLLAELESPTLRALVWLYIDDLEMSHEISQALDTPLGSFLHGVMHRREGDFSNAKYWFRRAGTVPFELAGYDPYEFVDRVSRANGDPVELVELQRQEWLALQLMA